MRGLKRKVIRIKAEDSPNVRLSLAEISAGEEPSGIVLVPGVKQYWEYAVNRRDWDSHQQCVSLDADWYDGAEILMFPSSVLNVCERNAEALINSKRVAKAIGVDTGEGSADTSVAVIDELGLIELESRKTPDTSEIPGWVIAMARKHNVPPTKIMFDRGGGGYEHACTLRKQGYAVVTVAFGETISTPVKPRGVLHHPLQQRKELKEEQYIYKNRRAEMYHKASLLTKAGFALPRAYYELRRQLAAVPLQYDEEGRIFLPPKQSKPGDEDKDKDTMMKRLGCSPDQSDAMVLAIHGMTTKTGGYVVKSIV